MARPYEPSDRPRPRGHLRLVDPLDEAVATRVPDGRPAPVEPRAVPGPVPSRPLGLDPASPCDAELIRMEGQLAAGLGAELLSLDDPLDVEDALCHTLAITPDQAGRMSCGSGAGVDELRAALADTFVCGATAAGGPEGLAILRAITHLTRADLAADAESAGDVLARQGVPEPAWERQIGRPAFLGAWTFGDVAGRQTAVHLHFGYRQGEHVVSVLVDHALGGGVKDCWVVSGPDVAGLRRRVLQDVTADPAVFAQDVPPAEAVALLGRALAHEPCPAGDEQAENVARYLYLVVSRVRHLARLHGLGEPGPVVDGAEGLRTVLAAQTLQLTVTVDGSSPPSWRRLEVRADTSLADLARFVAALFDHDAPPRRPLVVPPPGRRARPGEPPRPAHVFITRHGGSPLPWPEELEAEVPASALLAEPGERLRLKVFSPEERSFRIVLDQVRRVRAAGRHRPRCLDGATPGGAGFDRAAAQHALDALHLSPAPV